MITRLHMHPFFSLHRYSEQLSTYRHHHTDRTSRPTLLPSFFLHAHHVLLSLWASVAGQARGIGIFRAHHTHRRFPVYHGDFRVSLPFGMTRIGEQAKHLGLKIVWLVAGISRIQACQLHPDTGLVEKLLPWFPRKKGRD